MGNHDKSADWSRKEWAKALTEDLVIDQKSGDNIMKKRSHDE